MKRTEKSHKEGKDARYGDVGYKKCPYHGNLAFRWREGWREGDEEINERRDRRKQFASVTA